MRNSHAFFPAKHKRFLACTMLVFSKQFEASLGKVIDRNMFAKAWRRVSSPPPWVPSADEALTLRMVGIATCVNSERFNAILWLWNRRDSAEIMNMLWILPLCDSAAGKSAASAQQLRNPIGLHGNAVSKHFYAFPSLASSLNNLAAKVQNIQDFVVHTPMSEPRIPIPEFFSGDRSSFLNFRNNCKLFLSLKSHSSGDPAQQVKIVISFLLGDPQNWAFALAPGNPALLNVDAFFLALGLLYEEPNLEIQAEKALLALSQGQDEAEIYCQKFRKWSVLTQWNECALAAKFRDGLSEAIKDVMVGFPAPTGLNESMTMAIQIDRRLWERKPVHHLAVSSEQAPEIMQCDRIQSRSERQNYRRKNGLCFYCGDSAHVISACSKRTKKVDKSVAIGTLQSKFILSVTLICSLSSISVDAYVDSGAALSLMDWSFANRCGFSLEPLEVPIPLKGIDSTPLAMNKPQYWTQVTMRMTPVHQEVIRFLSFMHDIFREYLDKFIIVYLDDVLFFSDDWESHVQQVSSPMFKPRFIGPYRILEILNPVSFRLDLPASFAIHNVFHRSLLRKYEVPVVPSLEPPAPVLVEGELENLMPRSLDHQITVEKTPSYFVTREAPHRISHMSPRVKLIVVVRNPVTRAISDYTQTLSKKPDIPSFSELAFLNRTSGEVDTSWNAIRIGLYALHLQPWLNHFPISQMHFVSGERLITDPAGEMARVQDFLGLKRLVSEKHFYFNKTKGFPCLKKPGGGGAPRCLGKSKGRAHVQINTEDIEQLREFYRPHNIKFYETVGQDFHWE
ncbi:unnamed protein product [Ranitomeya imitator]|uniref:Sulfotransferase n=1 Tax=Ranitomeya imitator TaxID=111125 RepID=A0ABN9LRX0_9NEOB|nr:unnamed protein product [Ranitomeya imitator]